MVQSKVDDLKMKLEMEFRSTLGELSDLKLRVTEKEDSITKLNTLISRQEKQISQLKIKMDRETFESSLFSKVAVLLTCIPIINQI